MARHLRRRHPGRPRAVARPRDHPGSRDRAPGAWTAEAPQVTRRGGLLCRSRTCGAGGQGRGRTADLPLFRRTLVPTELPGQATETIQEPTGAGENRADGRAGFVEPDGRWRATSSDRTNTPGGRAPSVSRMSNLDDVQAWIDEQLPALLEKYDVPAAAWARPRRRRGRRRRRRRPQQGHRRRGDARLGLPDRLDHQALDQHAGHAAGRRGQGRPRRADPHLPAGVPDRRRGGRRADHRAPAAQPHRRLRGRHLHRHRRRRRLRREVPRRAARGAAAVPARRAVLLQQRRLLRARPPGRGAPREDVRRLPARAPLRAARPHPRGDQRLRGDHVPRRASATSSWSPAPATSPRRLGLGPLERAGRLDARDAPARPARPSPDAPRRRQGRRRHPGARARHRRRGCTPARSSCPTSA